MKIAIDIDDTIVSTRELIEVVWKEYAIRRNLPLEVPDNMNNGWNDKVINEFWDEYRENLFSPEVKYYAKEAISYLRSKGNYIVILTSRPSFKYRFLRTRLLSYLAENEIYVDEIVTGIIDKGKYMKENNIDVLIDDTINNVLSAQANEKIGVLFGEYPEYDGIRLQSWSQIDQIDFTRKLQ